MRSRERQKKRKTDKTPFFIFGCRILKKRVISGFKLEKIENQDDHNTAIYLKEDIVREIYDKIISCLLKQ